MSSLAAVFQIGSLGDSIVSLPTLRSLRERLPDCSGYILVSRFDNATKVSPTHVFDMAWQPTERVEYRPSEGRLRKLVSTTAMLARLRYYGPRSCVYLMPSERREDQISRDSAFFKAAGVRELIGFQAYSPSELQDGSRAEAKSTEAYLRFQRVWGERADQQYRCYATTSQLQPDESATRRVQEWLASKRRFPERRLIAVCPFSNCSARHIPPAVATELVRALEQSGIAEVVVLGGSKDADGALSLISAAGAGISGCGEFSVSQSAAMLKGCALAVCAESGPMHLAGALGIATVSTFSRVNKALHRWFPLGGPHTILHREPACAGCRLVSCPVEGHPCMTGISASELFAATAARLEGRELIGFSSGTKVINWTHR